MTAAAQGARRADSLARRAANFARRLRNAVARLSDSRARAMARLFRRADSQRKPDRILFWVPGGMPQMLHLEGALAAGLRTRGVEVSAVICDGPYRACVRREIGDKTAVADWSALCPSCFLGTSRGLHDLNIPYSGMSEFVSPELRAQLWRETEGVSWETIEGVSYQGVNLGKNIQSAITRYLQGRNICGHEEIVREYAFSALVSAAAAAEALQRLRP